MDESDITVSHVTDTTALAPAARRSLLECFDAITNLIWCKPADVFQRLEAWVFASDTGLLLARARSGELVGFSVYRRLPLDPTLIIHRETTNVRPAAQGRGVWTAFTRRLLHDLVPATAGRLHLASRTRNPIIYMAYYGVCEAIVPDLLQGSTDHDLEELAPRAAERLYPHLHLHRPSMIMADAYLGADYREAPRHRDHMINTRFFALPGLERPTNALFLLGRVKV
ncbi:MAG: hypothetical protein ACREKS_16030 [Candidatus Rokuibacteriota bacterium]